MPNVDVDMSPKCEEEISMPASDQFVALNERQMLNQAATVEAQGNRANAGDNAVAELVRNGFGSISVNAIQLVGAKAAQNLEVDRLSQQVLAQRAARNQPAPTVGGPADQVGA